MGKTWADEMSLKTSLNELVEELDRTHSEGFFHSRETNDFPDFVTATNGQACIFTKKARESLSVIAATIHANGKSISSQIELEAFEKLVKQCVANLHADGNLNTPEEHLRKLNDEIQIALSQMNLEFTHYFPAWTVGMEKERPFVLGPITIMTRDQWIDSVHFPPGATKYLNLHESNARWKESLKQALNVPKGDADIEGLAELVYSAIGNCSSILKVSVKGYEKDLSRKVAEIACKSALDSISLLLGANDVFHQQTLCNERLQPIRSHSIIETDGNLWLPGSHLGARIPKANASDVRDCLIEGAEYLEACGRILKSLVDPTAAKYPKLSQRWATALDWMAEGSREKNDAVALAKVASSLDVLACNGRFGGILNMLVHLTKISESIEVVGGRNPLTLRDVVKNIYDSGRSQILHGTHIDRLKSFEAWRGHAAFFSRLALIECALRLDKFSGQDGDTEFRMMPE